MSPRCGLSWPPYFKFRLFLPLPACPTLLSSLLFPHSTYLTQLKKYIVIFIYFDNKFFIFKKKLLYCYSIIVVCIFSPPLPPTPAKPTSLPCFHPPPWFCPWVLYSSSWKPFSPLSPPCSLLAIVRLFLISMSLVILFAFFFCWLCSS